MADIIQLLPDSIANQIAAGEVVQRPASAVKELLENAIDAGSTEIKLFLKDAGKTLIQVIDNGCGMSDTDARMSFERHATSKIRTTNDLFAIRTMGFRGEALASIAAIAHVELKTRRQIDELGTKIVMEGSKVLSQEPCQSPSGTSIQIKNLFYNIPARRKFLKSNAVEMRHIVEEFQRIALANPDIFFSMHHNNSEVFHLPKGNIRQRIVNVFGKYSNKKLVPIEEHTDVIGLKGFIGKPEYSKKTRGEQYFFVNNRFIKSPYLHHAIMAAYDDLIQSDTYPLYVVFLEIEPEKIDINVHPTKQEIKFDDEKLIYNYLKVTIKHALGQYSITPSLDFEREGGMTPYSTEANSPMNRLNIDKPKSTNFGKIDLGDKDEKKRKKNNLQNWQQLYQGLQKMQSESVDESNDTEKSDNTVTITSKWGENNPIDDKTKSFSQEVRAAYQVHNTYIINQIKSGFLVIDQQSAHERILYEQYLESLHKKQTLTQKELFPIEVSINKDDIDIFKEMKPQIEKMGFEIIVKNDSQIEVHGIPADISNEFDIKESIESLLEQYKMNVDLDLNINETIAMSLAKSTCIKHGKKMSELEMKTLIDQLFACEMPYKSPSGRNCFITIELDELHQRFSN